MMTIRQAVPCDLDTVLSILHSAQRWLRGRGYEQWPDGSPSLGPIRIGKQISRGEFWIASNDLDPVGVIAISLTGDADFWTPDELAEPAAYLSKAAVVRQAAGRGLGAKLLRWACDRAAADANWVRLDVWKTNTELQDYYQRQGWRYLRTVDAPGRNSGALFEVLATRHPEAASAFTALETPRICPDRVSAGMPVIALTDSGPLSADCVRVMSDIGSEVVGTVSEHGVGAGRRFYEVRRDGNVWIVSDAWPDPARLRAA